VDKITHLLSAGFVSAELWHFSLYAVLSYQPPISPTAQPTTAPAVIQPPITVPPTAPFASTTTPPPTTVATGDSGAPIAAIAGGAVGGILVIGIVAFTYHRYLRRQTSARVEPIQAIEGSGSDDAAHPLLGEGMFLSPCTYLILKLCPGNI
jgi:hypothetical protein